MNEDAGDMGREGKLTSIPCAPYLSSCLDHCLDHRACVVPKKCPDQIVLAGLDFLSEMWVYPSSQNDRAMVTRFSTIGRFE